MTVAARAIKRFTPSLGITVGTFWSGVKMNEDLEKHSVSIDDDSRKVLSSAKLCIEQQRLLTVVFVTNDDLGLVTERVSFRDTSRKASLHHLASCPEEMAAQLAIHAKMHLGEEGLIVVSRPIVGPGTKRSLHFLGVKDDGGRRIVQYPYFQGVSFPRRTRFAFCLA